MQRRIFLKHLCASMIAAPLLRANGAPFQPGPARSVIEIWMWGGPSSLETFDPKPDAGRDYNNGMKAIDTAAPGLTLSEFLPKLAEQAALFSLVRTLHHPHAGHENASYLMRTGRNPGGPVFPSVGAMVASLKAPGYKGDIPPYVILPNTNGRFSETGFLGDACAPLVTGGDPNGQRFAVDGIVPPGGLTAEMADQRLALLDEIDTFTRSAPAGALEAFHAAGGHIRRVIHGNAAKVFDLSEEPADVRDRYGRNTFGQSCLAARRLVEAGVPYIMVNADGWDNHKQLFETFKRKGPVFDQGLSALLADLSRRELLASTIVSCCGEFGRTPRIQREPPWNGGRGHFPGCFSALLAGGGFKGGLVVGKSDDTATKPAERPVSPQDYLGSICERMGIDPDASLPNPAGIHAPVLPPESAAGRLRELYA